MANIKYFSDVAGDAVALTAPHGMPNKAFAARWPGVKVIPYDVYQTLVGHAGGNLGGATLPVMRKIEYKSLPSRQEGNAKCVNGKANGACLFSSILNAA
ncbi:hypothetical protein [Achromobacter sp. DH1f]|uniref:hypothetical protein n=1 Tax=Achromobacter sp. DH1f TaxID=1397275 RepID=UPI00046AE457|nr:hypothetical protein [Achromobacter sp. DH1f]